MRVRPRLIAVSCSLLLFGASCSSVLAATPASAAQTVWKIGELENRFFEHTYADENNDQRLGRLEQMVFGQPRKGSDQKRIGDLIAAVPPEKSNSAKQSVQPAQPKMDPSAGETVPYSQESRADDAAANRSNNWHTSQKIGYQSPTGSGYQSSNSNPGYQQQPSGYQQSSPNYQQAPSNYQQQASSNYQQQSGPSNSAGMAQQISVLESQVFGQPHAADSIPFRLAALEDTVFASNADHCGSLSARIARLNAAVGTDGSGNSTAQAPVNYKQASASQYTSGANQNYKPKNGHPVLKNVAKTAVVVGAVAGVAALTIFAVKGMGGHHHLDLD